MSSKEKPIIWHASAKRELTSFPEAVYVLYALKKESTGGIGQSLKDTRTLSARHKAALKARAAQLTQAKK